MVSPSNLPLTHLLPLSAENTWSDLLAVLIQSDPAAAASAFGLPAPLRAPTVRREESIGGRDRLDLLIDDPGEPPVVVEVKVLSGVGRDQLIRYREAVPDARAYVLLHPGRLAVPGAGDTRWVNLSWEWVLAAFAGSAHPWVAATARAWLRHLDAAIPPVDADNRWNGLRAGEDFAVALRARMSWVFWRLTPPEGVTADLVSSAAGRSWVARLHAPARQEGYRVGAEAQERLPVQSFPTTAEHEDRRIKGPHVLVGLAQEGVRTSAEYDWSYLAAMWPLMSAARSDWVGPKKRGPDEPHDREAWRAMVDSGGPSCLGAGYGHKQALRHGGCVFGARFRLPPDATLRAVADALNSTAELLLQMSRVPRRESPHRAALPI